MKKLIVLIAFISFFTNVKAQSPGDTVEVRTFNYTQTYGINQWSPGIRDSVINFPTDTSISYEKILMLYNMRCKDGNISPPVSGQTDIGCGEWDMSCNSYLYDSTRVDSFATTTPSHIIANFSGTTFNYVSSPMNDYWKYIQKSVMINSE